MIVEYIVIYVIIVVRSLESEIILFWDLKIEIRGVCF